MLKNSWPGAAERTEKDELENPDSHLPEINGGGGLAG